MSAYLIVDITRINDEKTYAAYRSRVSPGLEDAGGQYLVRGSPAEVLEGDWSPNRVVIVRFDSMEDARNWWSSPEYAEPKEMRQASTVTNMILVPGVEDEVGR